jgi:hypothetical protein
VHISLGDIQVFLLLSWPLRLGKEDELYCKKSIGTTSTLVLLPYSFRGIGTALEQLFLMRFRVLIDTKQR